MSKSKSTVTTVETRLGGVKGETETECPRWVSEIVGNNKVRWPPTLDFSRATVFGRHEYSMGGGYLVITPFSDCCGARTLSPFPFECRRPVRWEQKLAVEQTRRRLPGLLKSIGGSKSIFCILTPVQRDVFQEVLEKEFGFEPIGIPWINSATTRELQMFQATIS